MSDRRNELIGEVSRRPGAFFRFAIGLCRVVVFVFGLRLELRGAEHLPRDEHGRLAGGWIAVPVPHRRWIDPFLLLLLLPIEPRLAFFADGRVLVRTRMRRLLFRLLGGMVPVWPRGGAKAFWAHIEAARRVLEADAVFVIFPEAGPASEPHRTRPIEPGFGYLAMRTGATLVPMVIGGTGELYRRRRLVLSVLPATTPQELAGRPHGAASPDPGSPDERAEARKIADAFAVLMAPPVADLHHEIERASAGDRKRWRWMTHWLDWDADAADAARAARDKGSG
ncbi:MAG: 1-acyl-sn-glycerol-3-phosphate acyltransferase [Chloroflexota bacterium]|nr:1-acyl-sn-glycerol-3-phosphate acyltransferase [Chloroflexota bacterium]